MLAKTDPFNPWALDDEGEHPKSSMEWWCAEAFFSSNFDKKKWSVKADFMQWCAKTGVHGSMYNLRLFDFQTGKHYIYDERDETQKLHITNNPFSAMFQDSFFQGAFPTYTIHCVDQKNDIALDLSYNSSSYPHWVAQDITGGFLPAGLGFYRYGFIPKNILTGNLRIHDTTTKITGQGYIEHVYGDFSYHKLGAEQAGLHKTFSTYSKLIGWWMKNHAFHIPEKITLSTSNNPLGYDWMWGLLDNGWTLFYGNILFWIMQGPIAGSLILSKDGKTYTEFSNVTFRYTAMRHAKEFNVLYPTGIEMTATNKKETLHLTVTTTDEPYEHTRKFTNEKFWKGFLIAEAPGTIQGYYSDGKETIPLSGICKLEPQRQISKLGHNTLSITLLKPPKGIGKTIELDSSLLKKTCVMKVQLLPKPRINFSMSRHANTVSSKKEVEDYS